MTLVGYWPLNEDSGTTVYDHSINSSKGTLRGSATRNVGVLGQTCYGFDGSNGSLVETEAFNPYSNGAVTICAWIKASTHYTSPSVNKWFLNHYDDGNNRFGGFIGTSGNLKSYLKVGGNTYSGEMNGNPLQAGQWHHVTLRCTQDRTSVWIDGKKKASGSVGGDVTSIGRGKLYVNEYKDDDSYNYELNASYNEVRVYNRPLTKNEIQYLYSVGGRGLQTTSKKSS